MIEIILFVWCVFLTICMVVMFRLQINQQQIMFALHKRLDDSVCHFEKMSGHIYCKDYDDDFTCPKVNKK